VKKDFSDAGVEENIISFKDIPSYYQIIKIKLLGECYAETKVHFLINAFNAFFYSINICFCSESNLL